MSQMLPNDVIHAHPNMGGLGDLHIANIIGINQILILVQALNDETMLGKIMRAAVELFFGTYTGMGKAALETQCTDYTDNINQNWVYTVNSWMEKHKLAI